MMLKVRTRSARARAGFIFCALWASSQARSLSRPIAEPLNQRGHAVCKSLVVGLFIRRKTEIRCRKFDRESHWHRFGAADFSCGANE
jgi:hypothetical protein